jgi:hypothetical protein
MKILFLPFRILAVLALIVVGFVVLTIWWPLAVGKAIWRDFRDESR